VDGLGRWKLAPGDVLPASGLFRLKGRMKSVYFVIDRGSRQRSACVHPLYCCFPVKSSQPSFPRMQNTRFRLSSPVYDYGCNGQPRQVLEYSCTLYRSIIGRKDEGWGSKIEEMNIRYGKEVDSLIEMRRSLKCNLSSTCWISWATLTCRPQFLVLDHGD